MKRRWLIPLMLIGVIGILGFGLTGGGAQKVQKMNHEAVRAENPGCEVEALNPLREERYSGIVSAVKEHYRQLDSDRAFIKAYDNIRVYTKLGKYTGSYIVFVKYEMEIKDIYTKVPGLGTLYAEKNGTSGKYEIKNDSKDAEFKEYMSLIGSHEDVKKLLDETNEEYEKAVNSDALLKEALMDLKNAYENQAGIR